MDTNFPDWSHRMGTTSLSHERVCRGRLAVIVVSLSMATFATLTLPACNTTEGVGEDLEAAGDNLSDAARDTKD